MQKSFIGKDEIFDIINIKTSKFKILKRYLNLFLWIQSNALLTILCKNMITLSNNSLAD